MEQEHAQTPEQEAPQEPVLRVVPSVAPEAFDVDAWLQQRERAIQALKQQEADLVAWLEDTRAKLRMLENPGKGIKSKAPPAPAPVEPAEEPVIEAEAEYADTHRATVFARHKRVLEAIGSRAMSINQLAHRLNEPRHNVYTSIQYLKKRGFTINITEGTSSAGRRCFLVSR